MWSQRARTLCKRGLRGCNGQIVLAPALAALRPRMGETKDGNLPAEQTRSCCRGRTQLGRKGDVTALRHK